MADSDPSSFSAPSDAPTIDPQRYRQVLGQYPTGVCVVTARLAAGDIVAMVVGSFSSVSLNPPLVAFFPDKNSSSWAKLRQCESFCVNILSADQEDLCRKLASKDPDKFAGIPIVFSAGGNPILDGVVAWIDCDRFAISDAGDHEMVTGRVKALEVGAGGLPLLFFRGGYGRFAPASLVADEGQGITLAQLRSVDRARAAMEQLTEQVGGLCIATVRVGEELAVAASAGQATRGSTTTLVGQRLPFVPPTGAVFAAWLPDAERARYGGRRTTTSGVAPPSATLDEVRRRGFSVGLRNEAQRALAERLRASAEDSQHLNIEDLLGQLAYDPIELSPDLRRDIRLISAPVFDSSGIVMALTLYEFPKPDEVGGIGGYIEQLTTTAAEVSAALGGAPGGRP